MTHPPLGSPALSAGLEPTSVCPYVAVVGADHMVLECAKMREQHPWLQSWYDWWIL